MADRAAAKAEAQAAVRLLRLRRGARVLDVACGYGRHVAELQRLGLRAAGVDLSGPMLASARQYAARHRLAASYARADFRALPFRRAFAAAFNFFLSFGYLDDRQNALVLAELADILKPGGRLLMDAWNPERVLPELRPKFIERRADAVIIERTRYREDTRRVEWQTSVRLRDGRHARWTQSVRLYGADELAAMLRTAGFQKLRRLGDWDGRPFRAGSPRLILVAERKR